MQNLATSNGMNDNELLNSMPTNKEEVSKKSLGISMPTKFKLPNKKVLYAIVVAIILGVLAFFFKSYFVVAMVNGSFVSRASFDKEMQSQIGQKTLDSLIITKLIEAKIADVEVSQEEVASEIKKTEDQLTAQGTTLSDTLALRGMSEKEFKKRITLQKKLEKFLADKTLITNEEVAQYLTTNKISRPQGIDPQAFTAQVLERLRQEKFNQEIQLLIDATKAEATIRYFIKL